MIGQREPEWRAKAYVNGEERELSSREFEGRWHVLYWYPRDFTFVCPTEIRGFQRLLPEFEEGGVRVIGISTDSFYSHKAWFSDRKTFDQSITHPVLADTSHQLSRAFGVLDESAGAAYRATVVIDDQGVIRSYAINDVEVGRSPREVLRTVQALQTGKLCGADWHKGEAFVG